ncbi:hypothetical protein TNCV_536381 [Trichonephila clavipes]|nr:hypothetical protein TNCV_536381 [Trichonephila clavipes]
MGGPCPPQGVLPQNWGLIEPNYAIPWIRLREGYIMDWRISLTYHIALRGSRKGAKEIRFSDDVAPHIIASGCRDMSRMIVS